MALSQQWKKNRWMTGLKGDLIHVCLQETCLTGEDWESKVGSRSVKQVETEDKLI